jgi:hypothetical protein
LMLSGFPSKSSFAISSAFSWRVFHARADSMIRELQELVGNGAPMS